MVHNPTCGCPSCFHINYPDRPNPHRVHTYKVRNTARSSSHSRPLVHQKAPYDWVRSDSITFYTECWWCGDPVYFHRNENGGCVLFERLGSPWPIHECWEQHKKEQSSAIQGLVYKRIEQIKSTSIKTYRFTEKTISIETPLEGFILGCDHDRRVLPYPSGLSDPETYLRFIVFMLTDGEFIKIIAPEKYINKIEEYSLSTIKIEHHKKGKASSFYCLREIEANAVLGSKSKTLSVNYDYELIMNMPWIHQANLTKS